VPSPESRCGGRCRRLRRVAVFRALVEAASTLNCSRPAGVSLNSKRVSSTSVICTEASEHSIHRLRGPRSAPINRSLKKSSTTGSRSDRPHTTFHTRQVPRHIRTPNLRSHTVLLGGLLLGGGLLLLGGGLPLLGGMCADEPAG